MKVFSACMKIVRYHKTTFLVYLLLFLALCAGMAILQKNPSALSLIHIYIDTNDLNTKVGAARKFISKGNKVKVTLRFREIGRAHV